ncbi:phosphatases II [Lentinus tigrinus ALCF2SS1-6]|uniref:Phosphatases II n=1 Tax=Lentinus tigrinus ALCF2SS1-6 TaxID=1328759 RepID=A0A5C2SIW2_9APHY|nr:phosphatases II [Lentinus tigrinus ALCF2SS1-6]
MATAIVDVRPVPSPASELPFARRVASGRASSQTRETTEITSHEDPVVAQLSRLASQHHASEYNRLKFGPKGSPLPYVPYSLQMPDHFQEMQVHQMQCAELRAWWLHQKQPSVRVPAEHWSVRTDEARVSMTASGPSAHPDLREQISAAISSSIILSGSQSADDRRATTLTPLPHWQTSETHPIVISTIIPSEVLLTISSQVRKATHRYPVVFNVPSAQLLDRLIPAPVEPVISKTVRSPPPHSIIVPRPTPASSPAQSLAKSLRLSSLFWIHPTVRRAFLLDSPQPTPKKRSRPASFVAPSKTSRSDGDLNSLARPRLVRNCSSPPVFECEPKDEPSRRVEVELPMVSHSTIISIAIPDVPTIPADASTKLLGNMYMSSCPGKKVRLDGPVRGRSTVCRDLKSDLTRISNVGVTCIICCLDDDELMSLGVDWVDYANVASELGIDVLRIPIPEGLAPIDLESLDAHLMKVIDTYTLRGSAVLVHCRGGVGRAGILACCWMLRLGLCGWLESQQTEASDSELVDDTTIDLIQRLISVVRRRRSPKAVETYEQVRFLVDYIKFLRDRSELSTVPTSYLDLFADWDTSVE